MISEKNIVIMERLREKALNENTATRKPKQDVSYSPGAWRTDPYYKAKS